MTGIDYLRTLHTKQLLNLKHEHRQAFIDDGEIECIWHSETVTVTHDEWKSVMRERPHVPSRLEGKRIRQLAAKFKVRSHVSPK
jgi:hypothetical protein